MELVLHQLILTLPVTYNIVNNSNQISDFLVSANPISREGLHCYRFPSMAKWFYFPVVMKSIFFVYQSMERSSEQFY